MINEEYKKTYKTVDEQILYLKNNKKIIVNEEQKKFLYERNYISVINPYKEFFTIGRDKSKNHIYRNKTDFIKIMQIIKVDDDFSRTVYSYISIFERKLKNILITEMCNKYMTEPEDIDCTTYISEIKNFIETDSKKDLPRFCPTYFVQLNKDNGIVKDTYGLESKQSLLKHILEIGTIDPNSNEHFNKANKLIKHYLKRQSIAPLWVIPNALTLGELKILFSMLDVDSQKRIIAIFLNKDNWEKLNAKDILSFSGVLEIIRNLRNTVNHFEPIFPYMQEQLKSYKNMNEAQLLKALRILKENYDNSSLINLDYINESDIESNPSTKRNIDILKIMKNYIK